jgi:hypothetical protein
VDDHQDANQFDFQVRRPGHFFFLKTDLARKRVIVRHSVVNLWGVMKVLHVFTGVQMDDPRQKPGLGADFHVGLFDGRRGRRFDFHGSEQPVYVVELPQKRLPGALVLGLGSLICGLFCVGLRWLF